MIAVMKGVEIAQSLQYRATTWMIRVQFSVRTGLYVFTTISRLALGPIESPVLNISLYPFMRIKQVLYEADNFPPTLPTYPHSPLKVSLV